MELALGNGGRLLVGSCFVLFSPLLASGELSWDVLSGSSNGTLDGGAGSWNSSAPNWTADGGLTNLFWDPLQTAVFGEASAAPGTVTLNGGGALTAGGVVFKASSDPAAGFTITGASAGDTLSITSGGVITQSGGANTIACPLMDQGNAINVLDGVLRLTNTRSGGAANNLGAAVITISGGALDASFGGPSVTGGGSSALGGASVNLAGGTLNLNGVLVSGGLTGQFYNIAPNAVSQPGAPASFANFGPAVGDVDNGALQTSQSFLYHAMPATLFSPTSGPAALMNINAASLGSGSLFGAGGSQDIGFTSSQSYVARWTGKIDITSAGETAFSTTSDDGSVVFVDGQMVVNNNAFQTATTRSGTIYLTAGLHDIVVLYYQNTSGSAMQLRYTPAGGASQIVPTSVLSGVQVQTPLGNSVNVTESSTINVNNALGAALGPVTIAPGRTLTIGGSGVLAASSTAISGSGARTVTFNVSGNGGAFSPGRLVGGLEASDSVTVVKEGAGQLLLENGGAGALANALSASSVFDVKAGRLTVDAAGASSSNPLGAAKVRLSGDGASLQLRNRGAAFVFDNPVEVAADATIQSVGGLSGITISTPALTLGSAANPVSITNGRTLTAEVLEGVLVLGGPLIGAGGNLVKTGPGQLDLTGTESYTGSMVLNGGTLNLTGAAAIDASGGVSGGGFKWIEGVLRVSHSAAIGFPVAIPVNTPTVASALEVNAPGLTGAGVISRPASGAVTVRLMNAGALSGTQLTPEFFRASDVIRLSADNIARLGKLPAAAIYEVFGGSVSQKETLLLNRSAGVGAHEAGVLTSSGSFSFSSSGDVILGAGGSLLAAPSGAVLTIGGNATPTSVFGGVNAATIGTAQSPGGVLRNGTVTIFGPSSEVFQAGSLTIAAGAFRIAGGGESFALGSGSELNTGTLSVTAGTILETMTAAMVGAGVVNEGTVRTGAGAASIGLLVGTGALNIGSATGSTGAGPFTLFVGGNHLSGTFAGAIASPNNNSSAALVKIGAGDWKLTNGGSTLGTGTGAGSLVLGSGTLTLSDGGKLTKVGSIVIRGGTLVIDDSGTNLPDRLPDIATVAVNGSGGILLKGKESAATAETLGALTIRSANAAAR